MTNVIEDVRYGPAVSADASGHGSAQRYAGLIRPDAAREGRQSNRRVSLARRAALPALVAALWAVLTGTNVIGPTTLSTPGATWNAFVNLLLHEDLVGDVGVSLRRAALGLAIGAGLGLVLGTFVGLFKLGEELLDSSLQMFHTVPYPAIIFLFIIWFGVGETAHLLLIALATLFPMYLNSSNAIRNVDRKVVEAARTFGLRGWRLVRQVVLPLALPGILTGLRYSAGISVVALVFTESIGTSNGIGYLVSQAESLQQVPNLVVLIIIYAVLGISADLFVRVLERWAMPWRRHQAVR
jgi:sulfonate transport system permease protein